MVDGGWWVVDGRLFGSLNLTTFIYIVANTFYPVSWDTQKGDKIALFWGVCGKSVPAGGWGHFLNFGVCASHEKCPTHTPEYGDDIRIRHDSVPKSTDDVTIGYG